MRFRLKCKKGFLWIFTFLLLSYSCKHNEKFISDVDSGLEKSQRKQSVKKDELEETYETINDEVNTCLTLWREFEMRMSISLPSIKKKFEQELEDRTDFQNVKDIAAGKDQLSIEEQLSLLEELGDILAKISEENLENLDRIKELAKSLVDCRV